MAKKSSFPRNPPEPPVCRGCGAPSAVIACKECRERVVNEEPDLRMRRIKATREKLAYLDTCSTHGETRHAWQHGHCLKCFTVGGAPRQSTWVQKAQETGSLWGLKRCEKHGEFTPHSLRHRKCLLCFSTDGLRRVRPVMWFAHDADELEKRRQHLGLPSDQWATILGVPLAQLMAWSTGYGGPVSMEALQMARFMTSDIRVLGGT